ncbi:MAG: DUF134 domain-containing protein [Clostridia bacterium]|nr:DUF134 domain-containing protein [Clostridia bacterium]
MPRRPKCRKIGFMPDHCRFSPDGSDEKPSENIILALDELEAIRLSDYLLYDQQKAAKHMEISRGTFQRVLNSAHLKVAEALLQGKVIQISGGNYILTDDIACCRDKRKVCSSCHNCENCHKKNY